MEYKLKKVQKLPDGRWQVLRSDGASLSLTADDWREVIDWIEDEIFEAETSEGTGNG